MNHKRANGFILLLVITMIPLVGLVVAMLSVNSRGMLIQTRLEVLALRAQTACDSAVAWADLHKSEIIKLTEDGKIELAFERSSCVIEFSSRDDAGTTIKVTGTASDKRFSQTARRNLLIRP